MSENTLLTTTNDCSTDPMRQWRIRLYEEGDEAEIIRLWQRVFAKPYSIQRWNWFFRMNPYYPVRPSLAFSSDGRLIGQFTALPLRINYRGRAVRGCLGLDLVVDPQFHRRGVFQAVEETFSERISGEGFRLIYAPPHRNSYPGLMRRLGWKRVTFLRRYECRVAIEERIRSICRLRLPARVANYLYARSLRARLWFRYLRLRRAGSGLVFHRSTSVPAGYDRLWDDVRSYEVISVWKDEEYFRWRYDQNPDKRYEYFFLTAGDEIVALSVAASDGSHLHELIVKDRDVRVGRMLLNRVLAHYAGRAHSHLLFFGFDFGFFDACFAPEFRREMATQLPICAKVWGHDDLCDDFRLPDNWTIAYGDLD
jgi:GNAT superfamily N-acetyltransferase